MAFSAFNVRAADRPCRFAWLHAARLRFPARRPLRFRTQPPPGTADSAAIMKSRYLRARSAALLLLSCLAVSACADERPPPTRDEVLWACGTYNLEVCRAFGRCLGWTDAEIQDCVNDENAECADDLQAESCWENQRDALERCTADVADDACSEVCNNGFCGAQCLYFCPSSAD